MYFFQVRQHSTPTAEGMELQTFAKPSTSLTSNVTERLSSFSSTSSFPRSGKSKMDKLDSGKSNGSATPDNNCHSNDPPDQKWASIEPARSGSQGRQPIDIFGLNALRTSHGSPRLCSQGLQAAARPTASTSREEPRPKPGKLETRSLSHLFAQEPVVPPAMYNANKGRKHRRIEGMHSSKENRRGAPPTRGGVKLSTILEEVDL